MKKNFLKTGAVISAFPVSALSIAISSVATAQPVNPIEEVLILGRLRDSAGDIVVERMEQSVAIDIMGAEQIGRIGDTTVANALQRMPGVTLVDDKYVYVRGLGERYLSSTLNGATVPSPDLTRNVLPLDIFPTSIVESLAVQKAYSADMAATFGGGSVDIRTKGIPAATSFSFEVSTGTTSNGGDFLTYEGGSDDKWGNDDGTRELSTNLKSALDMYLGDFSEESIIKYNPNVSTREEAAQVRRELAAELYRDLSVKTENGSPDAGLKISGGSVYGFENGVEVGFLAGGSYSSKWRNESKTSRNIGALDEQVEFEESSTHSVDISGNFSLGFRLNEVNTIETTSLYIRNTDDETAIVNIFDENRQISDGQGFRDYNFEYEQRELIVNQIHGKHELDEDTRDMLGLGFLSFLDGLKVNWYYSDSEVTTDKPNEATIEAYTVSDSEGNVLSSTIQPKNNVANYRYTELQDYLDSMGADARLPLEFSKFYIELSGGWEYWKKARTYKQLEFAMGMEQKDGDNLPLDQGISPVFSNTNVLSDEFDFGITSRNTNSNSYIAANILTAYFGALDINYDEFIKFNLGVRWEDYKHSVLNWNPLAYTSSQISYKNGDISYRTEDDYFGTASLTFMFTDFWAQDFQIRTNYAQTTVRPDLREISPSSFNDPLTDLTVFGNPSVESSSINHTDLRFEWFFSSGDTFTVSAFHKDVEKPIELFALPVSDGGLAAEVENAESGTIQGIEIEGLKSLGQITEVLDPFFIQGNLTLLDSNIKVGEEANAPTNQEREMNGASPYAFNFILGFDSTDSKHAATLSYNIFGERLFIAGRNGDTDIYENPFNSLNLTYSYYPTDSLTIKFKMKNLLDETSSYKREDENGVDQDIIEIEEGQEFSLSLNYTY